MQSTGGDLPNPQGLSASDSGKLSTNNPPWASVDLRSFRQVIKKTNLEAAPNAAIPFASKPCF
jgi:hypothetical protein